MHSQSKRGGGDPVDSDRANLVSLSDYVNPSPGKSALQSDRLRILAILGNPEANRRAVNHLLALGKLVPALEVIVVHDSQMRPWKPSPQFDSGNQHGLSRLAQRSHELADGKLTAAGISCKSEFGETAQDILDCCRIEKLHAIVVAEGKQGLIDRFVLRPFGLTRLPSAVLTGEMANIPICIVR
jgi:hypothetical protein